MTRRAEFCSGGSVVCSATEQRNPLITKRKNVCSGCSGFFEGVSGKSCKCRSNVLRGKCKNTPIFHTLYFYQNRTIYYIYYYLLYLFRRKLGFARVFSQSCLFRNTIKTRNKLLPIVQTSPFLFRSGQPDRNRTHHPTLITRVNPTNL